MPRTKVNIFLIFTIQSMPEIPLDIYESPAEMVVHLPLWWVSKESISLALDANMLTIIAQRTKPSVKESLTSRDQQCYRGSFEKTIAIPSTSFFNGITSTLTPENILIITIPKVMVPKHIPVTVE
jgi:HSP20 family molecular chaperone IbpA